MEEPAPGTITVDSYSQVYGSVHPDSSYGVGFTYRVPDLTSQLGSARDTTSLAHTTSGTPSAVTSLQQTYMNELMCQADQMTSSLPTAETSVASHPDMNQQVLPHFSYAPSSYLGFNIKNEPSSPATLENTQTNSVSNLIRSSVVENIRLSDAVYQNSPVLQHSQEHVPHSIGEQRNEFHRQQIYQQNHEQIFEPLPSILSSDQTATEHILSSEGYPDLGTRSHEPLHQTPSTMRASMGNSTCSQAVPAPSTGTVSSTQMLSPHIVASSSAAASFDYSSKPS